jgi:predicted nucleic-acid-binding protein
MIALDTNILVRFTVCDDEKQAGKVYRFFKKVEGDHEVLFVSAQVTLELIWVLKSLYEYKRSDIIDAVEHLFALPVLQFYHSDTISVFIKMARDSNYDLADLLIGLAGHSQKCQTTITLDRKAAKSNLFELLK